MKLVVTGTVTIVPYMQSFPITDTYDLPITSPSRPWDEYIVNPYYNVMHHNINSTAWHLQAKEVFPNVRDFTSYEVTLYDQAINRLFQPTGKSFFD